MYTGDDFSTSVHVVKFSVGQIISTVCIPVHDDSLNEGNEYFYILLCVPNTAEPVPGQRVMARVIIYG